MNSIRLEYIILLISFSLCPGFCFRFELSSQSCKCQEHIMLDACQYDSAICLTFFLVSKSGKQYLFRLQLQKNQHGIRKVRKYL